MRNTWKSVAALVCAGTLLVTGCGTMGDGNSSVSGTSKDGTTEIEVRSSEAAKDDDAAYADEATSVKIGIPAAKADPDSPDKEETVHVKADAGGSVTGVTVDNKDDDLDDIDELTDNMKELNDATSEMVEGAGKLLEGTETFESGLAEYVSAVSQVSSGMSQLSDGIAQLSNNKGKLYEGSAALSQGLSKIEESFA